MQGINKMLYMPQLHARLVPQTIQQSHSASVGHVSQYGYHPVPQLDEMAALRVIKPDCWMDVQAYKDSKGELVVQYAFVQAWG